MALIALPRNLNIETMRNMYSRCKDAVGSRDKYLVLNFNTLGFIDPMGATALACMAVGFTSIGADVTFAGIDVDSPAVQYLNSAGFFEVLSGGDEPRLARRETTIEFTAISGTEHVNFLHMQLRPWISREVRLSSDTVESLSACIAEALQNIEHHGGAVGFAMAQHYPKKRELVIAVADRGHGIPVLVRKVCPGLKDPAALEKACVRGFTTKNNYTNRGFGLDNLIRYAVVNNGGTVTLRSRNGKLVARRGPNGAALSSEFVDWDCPGCVVQVVLRTDTLENPDESVKQEVFEWF